MFVILSDLHLTDGTSSPTLSTGAFEIFAQELRGMAFEASFRDDDRYRPIERIDLLLLGDVLDPIRSGQWLLQPQARPWHDPQSPELIAAVKQITTDILRYNEPSLALLRQLVHGGGISVPPADAHGRPVMNVPAEPVEIAIHYMVGNHDWFYHLPGTAYHEIRAQVAKSMALVTRADHPFPHDPAESGGLLEIMRRHRVFARHGDIYDPLNFEGDRNASSLGDAIVIELLSRFIGQVERELGDDVPASTLLGLRDLDSVRPLLLAPVWLDGLLERTCPQPEIRTQIKRIWDQLSDAFLALPMVRARDTWSPVDLVDGLERALKFGKNVSLGAASRIVDWLHSLRGHRHDSYYPHALAEPDFRNRRAKYIVFGHTHVAEQIALDASYAEGYVLQQMYFNTGTWRRTLQRAVFAPKEHEFIPTDVMTYVAFYQGDERKGRPYESWTGTLGVNPPETPQLRLDEAHVEALSGPNYLSLGVTTEQLRESTSTSLPGAHNPARTSPTRRQRI